MKIDYSETEFAGWESEYKPKQYIGYQWVMCRGVYLLYKFWYSSPEEWEVWDQSECIAAFREKEK